MCLYILSTVVYQIVFRQCVFLYLYVGARSYFGNERIQLMAGCCWLHFSRPSRITKHHLQLARFHFSPYSFKKITIHSEWCWQRFAMTDPYFWRGRSLRSTALTATVHRQHLSMRAGCSIEYKIFRCLGYGYVCMNNNGNVSTFSQISISAEKQEQ